MNLTRLASLDFSPRYPYRALPPFHFAPTLNPRGVRGLQIFPLVSAVTAFHGFGFLPTLHLGFIENLTHETRLLPSSAVIIWFKRITGLKKAKFRFGLNHLVGKLGWYKAAFQGAVPCGRAVFNNYQQRTFKRHPTQCFLLMRREARKMGAGTS